MPEIRVSVDFRHSITVGFSDTFFQNETEIQTKVSRFQTTQKCLKTEHTKVWISDTYVLSILFCLWLNLTYNLAFNLTFNLTFSLTFNSTFKSTFNSIFNSIYKLFCFKPLFKLPDLQVQNLSQLLY